METLNNLLGPSPEWFEPVPIINGAYASSFQILEVIIIIGSPSYVYCLSLNEHFLYLGY